MRLQMGKRGRPHRRGGQLGPDLPALLVCFAAYNSVIPARARIAPADRTVEHRGKMFVEN
jgi:hypothetical protein